MRLSTLALPIWLAVLAPSAALAQTPSLTLVGFAPGNVASRIYGLSADGRSASGYSREATSGDTHFPGFRWSADTGRQDFGVGLAPALTLGFGISGDGSTVVGGALPTQSSGSTAFRWSQSGGYSTLGSLPFFAQSEARDANQDGSIIVGNVDNGNGTNTQAFRWTQGTGMQGLGANTNAYAISGNGNVIVGDYGTATQAFTWTQANGLQFLPSLGGTGPSLARAINSEGNIIVGRSGLELRTTMWVDGSPTELNSTISDSVLTPFGVSNDGSVVAGLINAGEGGMFPGVWTSATGTVPLTDYLTANGVTIPAGLSLFNCTAISSDGKTFAGWTSGALGTQGYVATIPAPGALGVFGVAGFVAIRRRRRDATQPLGVLNSCSSRGLHNAPAPRVLARLSTLALAFLVGLSVLAPSAALAQTPSLTLVGMAPGTGASRIYGLSADGRSASGYSQEPTSGTTRYPGFRWNADSGRQDFGVGLVPGLTLGYGISGDGLTVVGGAQATEFSGSTAFRWTQSGGYISLGTMPFFAQSEARDANHDGSIIVGTLHNGNGSGTQAFRWTQSGGMEGLGAGTTGQAISRDGSTIVGNFGTAPNAFLWTEANGIQFLPALGGTGASAGGGINFDGSIVVGASGLGNGRPTMWVNNIPMDLSDGISQASLSFGPSAVSDNGSVAAGQMRMGASLVAGIWTSETGVVPLASYLAANGVAVPAGMDLSICTSISSDGKTFAGWTTGTFGNQGYVATIPAPGALAPLGVAMAVASRRRRR